MISNLYDTLIQKISNMNDLNDQLKLIEFNLDDGPKFESIEEMREFEDRILNNEFDYLVAIDNKEIVSAFNNENIIDKIDYTLDDIYFFIYTLQKNNSFMTYLSFKKLEDNNVIGNLCGKENIDKELAHKYLIELKELVTTNTLDNIYNYLIKYVDDTIKQLKVKLAELTNIN